MLVKAVAAAFWGCLLWLFCPPFCPNTVCAETAADYSLLPPFLTTGAPPLVMLLVGRDHTLYFPAYNDYSDLDGDGAPDIHYKPSLDYYGYFDSHKCYAYSSASSRFEPAGTTTDKKCIGAYDDKWSGDFLNYLTMSRMDCLRKALYGGYRSTDTATETVLQRVYVPQDGHSWGREYRSIARDGYDIEDYTPLSLPVKGTCHLFASTTLSDNGDPILRVLPDNTHRIWDWVSKEGPVCDNSLETSGGSTTGSPASHDAYNSLIEQFAGSGHLQCSTNPSPAQIDGSGNPCGGSSPNYYLTVFTGGITITKGGSYQFAVDGDDAVEVLVDGTVVAGWYGGHAKCNCRAHDGAVTLAAGSHSLEYRHQQATGDSSYHLYWSGPDSSGSWEIVPAGHLTNLRQTVYDVQAPASHVTDYIVRVKVAVSSMPETNCQTYPDGNYKPVGILQKYGGSDRMYFGLMTGSYAKNLKGGVLRKRISSITDEIDAWTGRFKYLYNSGVQGIIKTMDLLRAHGFDYGTHSYDCGLLVTSPQNRYPDGTCSMWGNPIAEIMYETLRYFSGAASPTLDFTYSGTTPDTALGLPLADTADWTDPYTTYPGCSKPFMVVISDIYPSYDTDQLPGSVFSPFSGSTLAAAGLRPALDVRSEADFISTFEGLTGSHYIGQSGADYSGSCSAKTISGLGDIRGLCPEGPTRQGGYYSAAVARYGRTENIGSSPASPRNVTTCVVALGSPMPEIKIPVGTANTITLAPFGKSAFWAGVIDPAQGEFQPTNQCVGFYVTEEITPAHGKLLMNFEDAEQGSDFEMDAVETYEYQVVDGLGNPVSNAANGTAVDVTITSVYSSQAIQAHFGYIISGTTADGTYLVVRNSETSPADYVRYWMDTLIPPASVLPQTSTIRFYPGTAPSATLLKNPLWYAAKWGGFEDYNDNLLPDLSEEWDKTGDGAPDTYFYIQNPLEMEAQMNRSFADILRRSASGTAASLISSPRSGEGAVYQAVFHTEYKDSLGNKASWLGDVRALMVDAYGNMREDSNGNHQLDLIDDYVIQFSESSAGAVLKYRDLDGNGRLEAGEKVHPIAVDTTRACRPDEISNIPARDRRCIACLWSAASPLNGISDSDVEKQRSSYIGTEAKRHIFTFADGNMNMVPDTGEILPFVDSSSSIHPYLYAYPPFSTAPSFVANILAGYSANHAPFDDFLTRQSERVINFIRGKDQAAYTSPAFGYTIPAFRSRQVDGDEDGSAESWRLGDIVHSTPTVVAAPAENLDLLYKDSSYSDFSRRYRNRRIVVYAGGNDGMLHAFNGGFLDAAQHKFWKSYDFAKDLFPASNAVDVGPDLGAELWAYVPYNLLPHLFWLTEPAYNHSTHVSYVDAKPRVFDARIFPDDVTHPSGWGTVLVCGMGFGGGKVRADLDKTDGTAFNPAVDRTLGSAYFIIDVTDPESPPTLLAEVSSPALGFTIGSPTVITMKDKDPARTVNDWYLVLGSGPSGTTGADTTALVNGTSNQPARVVVLDLKQLTGIQPAISTLDSSGAFSAGMSIWAALDANAFISDFITVDYDLDYKADAVYFGTVSGSFTTGWGGKLRRILINNDSTPSNWTKDSTLLDLTSVFSGQPIVAAPAVGLDPAGQRWVFAGTGRFFNRQDATSSRASDRQSYYGIKEPKDASGSYTWAEVDRSGDLLEVGSASVFEGGDIVEGVSVGTPTGVTVIDYPSLKNAIAKKKGWALDFAAPKERNLGQATLLGNILTFTTYTPSSDPCQFEGTANLYALSFDTGTAYTGQVIGLGTAMRGSKYQILSRTSLGKGLSVTPNIHTGQEQGSVAFIQTSTGAILQVEEANPGTVKSGKISWKDWQTR